LAKNTLDAARHQPDSACQRNEGNNVPVSWSGQDEVNGSGIAMYDVYVSDNGGSFFRS